MLETFVKEHGIYYVIAALCAIGVAGKCYESNIYKMLLEAVENPERTSHPFMKQLKLKYKNYYKLQRKIYNTDAFVETSLFRYKHHFMGLENLHTINNRIMLLCIMVSCLGIAGCIYFQLETGMLMYHILAGAIAVAGLEFIEQQFGIESKRRMLLVSLKDYLENGLANQLEGRIRGEEKESVNINFSEKKEAKVPRNPLGELSKKQVAITENIAEKVASELAREKVIADVIEEFFP